MGWYIIEGTIRRRKSRSTGVWGYITGVTRSRRKVRRRKGGISGKKKRRGVQNEKEKITVRGATH